MLTDIHIYMFIFFSRLYGSPERFKAEANIFHS